ncbi:MAG: c-type cytochrome [Pseudomonadota bacterium]|nr:c-type cytochrome [Pseudomonadota bacterium]
MHRLLLITIIVSVAVVFAGLSACTDRNTTKLQYMPDMADAPTVKAQEDFLDPPPHSVARGAVYYGATAEESTVQPTVAPDLVQGKYLYETFCQVCHGAQGKGNGSIVEDFPRPPDITAEVYRQRSDAFIMHRVTFGTAIMPAYGHMTSVAERWQIVFYLRELQK